jgi:hypothetical protein
MFVNDQVNREGLFGILNYKNGKRNMVYIDNYFPVRNQKPVFAKANGKELWVMILEKAWAKLHGSYHRVLHGQSYEVYRDMLGAPAFYYKVNTGDTWETLMAAESKKYIISATAKMDLYNVSY